VLAKGLFRVYRGVMKAYVRICCARSGRMNRLKIGWIESLTE
jgi:hypothetical protein